MKINVTLFGFLAAAATIAKALGLAAKKRSARDDSFADHGAQFMSVLRRRLEPPAFTDVENGAGSLMDHGASIRNSRHVQVSRAQLAALRHVRSWMKQNKSEPLELPKTVIRDLGAEYVGTIGIGTTRCVASDSNASLKESDCAHTGAQSSLTSIVFDTGSTNLWMASTLCDKHPCTNTDRQRYDPMLSKTYHGLQEPMDLEVTFGSATLRGPLGIDDFHIGPFTVKNQVFALIAEERGPTFRDLPLEGIVGLAFPSMSANNHTPFFDSVIQQGVLKKNMFSFYLSYGESSLTRDSLLSSDSAMSDAHGSKIGAILWGGYDENLFEGPLMWFPVTKAHYWAIDLVDFRIGNESLPVTFGGTGSSLLQAVGDDRNGWGWNSESLPETPSQSYLIVDTGTTYYTAEGELYNTLESRLATADCNNVEHYPPLTYVLKDVHGVRRELTITQRDYMTSDGLNCELAFMQVGPPAKYGPAMILGELFMQKYFTVFDRGNGGDGDARIGIARSRNHALSSFLERSETGTTLRREPDKRMAHNGSPRMAPRSSSSGTSAFIDDSGKVEVDQYSIE